MITSIAKILVALGGNTRPGEMAAGFASGIWLALLPAGNLLWWALFVVHGFFRVNMAVLLLVLAGGSLLAPLLDPLMDALGVAVLGFGPLYPAFSALADMPLVSFTRFNDALVTGGFLTGLILWIPLFFVGKVLVKVLREQVFARIRESAWWKRLRSLPLFSKLGGAIADVHSRVAG
jgi:uncharacterized protein (TIGR03546 family)